MIARLVGAKPEEVIVCDSTSVNLFKALVAALRLRPDRNLIVSERGNFPTDVYVNEGVAELMGVELRCVEPWDVESAIRAAGRDLALVQLTHVNYRTGLVYDMARITALAHDQGALAIWDLSHRTGTLPVDLYACSVIGDYRAPDVLRFGFAGLYVRYVDVWDAVAELKDVMSTGAWDRPAPKERKAVT